MKTIFKLVIAAMMIWGYTSSSAAQEESLGSQVTKKVGMYVFLAKGQTQDQIDKDEADWSLNFCTDHCKGAYVSWQDFSYTIGMTNTFKSRLRTNNHDLQLSIGLAL